MAGAASQRRKQDELRPLRLVHDALVVAGSLPRVWRVLGTRRGSVTEFDLDLVDGQFFEGSALWPKDLFGTLVLYRSGFLLDTDVLPAVDVLQIWCGDGLYGTRADGYWLWQRVLSGQERLSPLTLIQTRQALGSPWLRVRRAPDREASRGIMLRE